MKKILFFLLISNCFFAQWSISNSERNALVSLYNSTNGTQWSQNWDFEKDPKYWYGIKTKNGHVTEINLRGNVLSGNFPAVFSVFTSLTKLDLSSNNLSGQISGSVSGLTNLVRLDLSNNRLEGDPSLTLSSLSNLEELSLGNNSFTVDDIDAFLQNFTKIKVLDLSNFGLTAVPQRLSTYNGMVSLNLSNNSITQNFSAISGKTSIEELNLSGNQLTQIPAVVNTLTNLKTLNLAHNQLSNVLNNTSNLIQLTWLSLEDNQISEIPAALASMGRLIHLNLGRNSISGGLSALLSNAELEQLFLDHNLLEGNFPTGLLQLGKLQMLSLVSNNLTGALPETVPAVTFLDNNRFTQSQLQNFLLQENSFADFTYSPQRYDEPKTVFAAVGESAALTQSLSGNDYQFTWFKNLDENTGVHTPNYSISSVAEDDFGVYTAEAYYLKSFSDFLMEVSFFREPITLENSLGTEETTKGIVIYPNPTSDYLNILSKNIRVEESSIYDLSGKLILQTKEQSMNVKHLPSGAYLISIKTASGTKTFKWIKH